MKFYLVHGVQHVPEPILVTTGIGHISIATFK